jgi:flagellar biosynthesis protein FliP
MKSLKPLLIFLFVAAGMWVSGDAHAQLSIPSLQLGMKQTSQPGEVVGVLQILVLLTVLSLAPAILIMMTSFTRIIVILSFMRQALGTNSMPPNQLLVGLAMFLTFIVMGPTISAVHKEAVVPYMDGKITQQEGLAAAQKPIRDFMLKHTRSKDVELMMRLTGDDKTVKSVQDVPFFTLVPAFMISELKTAFQMGFIVYLPFLILDMVVASVLMAMGMMMLPPVIISLPFKLMLFVLVDGWQLIVGSIVKSFA